MRSYARAVAGTLLSQSFDLETAAFEVKYRLPSQGATDLQSEIYVSSVYHYPLGFSVAFSPAACCSYAMLSPTVVAIRCACASARAAGALTVGCSHASGLQPGSEVTVSVTARSKQHQ